jgi:hypothetical protein
MKSQHDLLVERNGHVCTKEFVTNFKKLFIDQDAKLLKNKNLNYFF